jgi:hypothetical protein
MVKAHPYRALLAVALYGGICLFVAGMIGQYNDGPWGGLPEWLAAFTWFSFMLSIPALVVLGIYLAVVKTAERRRGSASTG